MKKFLARVLAAAMVLGMLTVSALAYDLPDNSLLQASNPSSGTAAVTDWEGESHTVYRYPAGTVFSVKTGMTNFAMVTDLSTGDTVPMVPQQQFTLPETGAYRLTAYDQGIWTTTAYVMAEGAPSPSPSPSRSPSRSPSPSPSGMRPARSTRSSPSTWSTWAATCRPAGQGTSPPTGRPSPCPSIPPAPCSSPSTP